MNTRRISVIVFAGIALVVIVAFAASAYWTRQQTPFQNIPKLISALQAFSHDQTAGGRQLPSEVSLHDLVQGGYLTTNDVGAFEGMDASFTTRIDDSNPQMIFGHALTPDGRFICLLADGSVQQLSRERYERLRKDLGQPGGAANRSQQFGSETNRTSAAAGSGR